MTLYEQWVQKAYDKNGASNEKLWDDYLPREQKIYEDILSNKKTLLKGTVQELGEIYDMPAEYICGFVDGVNEVLPELIDVNKLEADTELTLAIDFERLFKKMVEYKAEHLYTLPQWENIFTQEQLKAHYTEQKKSTTFVRNEKKIGRNDPCPCGSGKKYKKCCGTNAQNASE